MSIHFGFGQCISNASPFRIYPQLNSTLSLDFKSSNPVNREIDCHLFSLRKKGNCSIANLLHSDSDTQSFNSLTIEKSQKRKHMTKWEKSEVGEFSTTSIEGISIVCFNVWGEKRVCLPQLLRFILNDFDVDTILNKCSELKLICEKCNSGQLDILHRNKVLPENIDSCGLIRKSDAERLCKTLMRKGKHVEEKCSYPSMYSTSIDVVHHCFGKQKGNLFLDLYAAPDAKCIQCCECHHMFTPSYFVGHTHQNEEVMNVTHWGFDSANWRNYLKLLVSKDSSFSKLEVSEMRKKLELIKLKFLKLPNTKSKFNGSYKLETDTNWEPAKVGSVLPPPPKLFTSCLEGPLPSNFIRGSPVLVNPESVVLHSEAEKYDRQYIPNVCLVPQLKRSANESDNSANMEHAKGKLFTSSGSAFTSVMKDITIQPKNSVSSTENASIQMMRDIISDSLTTDTERTRLFEHFFQFQKVYNVKLNASIAESKQLNEMMSQEKTIHESIVKRLEQELVELKKAISAKSEQLRLKDETFAKEREIILRQVHEARCPDVHKTRAKYLVVKAELADVSSQRDMWRKRCQEHETQLKVYKASGDLEGPFEPRKRRRLLDDSELLSDMMEITDDQTEKATIIDAEISLSVG